MKLQKDHILITPAKTGVYYEDLGCFGESLFKDVYLRAFERTNEIIRQNEELLDNIRLGHTSKKYREIYNIIPFIGGRGTGKTSAMLSFMEAIKDYFRLYNKLGKSIFYTFNDNENILFTCLDCIDGSLLEKDENIFKVVLIQMYKKLQELDREGLNKGPDYKERRNELFINLDRLYRNIDVIYTKNYVDQGISSVESLRNMMSSVDLKEKFELLVKDYLSLINYAEYHRYYQNNQHYLVITLDDFDLNVHNGFNMLEKIHRYMMVPNVIILAAFDLSQLTMLCKHYYFEEVPNVSSVLEDSKAMISTLSVEYLNKVLPVETRIYMPHLEKSMALNLKICDETYTPKEGIFLAMYSCLGVRWDIGGLKRHFYEPKNIRALVGLNQLLGSLHVLPDMSDARFLEIYERNSVICESDIVYRMAGEKLSEGETARYFDNIGKMQLERMCQDFFKHCRPKYQNEKEADPVEYSYRYSYGQLAKNIYYWGREIEEKDDDRKELIKCFMALFSLKYTRLYTSYMCQTDMDKKTKIRQRILSVLGGSVAGEWADSFLPILMKRPNSRVKSGTATLVMPKDGLLSNLGITKGVFKNEDEERNKETIRRYIQSLELVCMLFCPVAGTGSVQWKFEFSNDNPRNAGVSSSGDLPEKSPQISKTEAPKNLADGVANPDFRKSSSTPEDRQVTYNFMNFVVNAIRYEEVLENVKNAFIGAFDDSEKEKIESLYDKYTLKYDFEKWEQAYGVFALPVYDFDITYNLLKRISKEKWSDKTVQEGELWIHIRTVFNKMKELLRENDAFYNNEKYTRQIYEIEKNEIDKKSLEQRFSSCPFVKVFYDDNGTAETISKVIEEILMINARNSNSTEQSSDE